MPGADGQIHVIDTVTRRIAVIGSWQEPLEWQQPRPAIFVRGGTDPGKKEIRAVEVASGVKTATSALAGVPNETSGCSSFDVGWSEQDQPRVQVIPVGTQLCSRFRRRCCEDREHRPGPRMPARWGSRPHLMNMIIMCA